MNVGKEFKHTSPNGVEFTYRLKSKRGSNFVVETFARGISQGTVTMSEERILNSAWSKEVKDDKKTPKEPTKI